MAVHSQNVNKIHDILERSKILSSMNYMRFLKTTGVSVIALALPLFAMAAGTPAQPGPATGATGVPTAGISSVQTALNFMCTIFGWAFYFLIALAVIFGVIAAFKYLTSSGEAEKVKSAGRTLLYMAIAVAVALLAKGIPLIMADFLGAGSSNIGACGAGGSGTYDGLPPHA
jgi:hypothetical protein